MFQVCSPASVPGILRWAKLSKENLTKEQRRALKELKQMDVAILPADKGNATVLMATEDYHTKMRGLLETTTYQRLKKDPTSTQENRISRKLRELEKGNELPESLYRRLRHSGCQPPMIYGLPKKHKTSVPLRPIVFCIGSPSYQLSKHISSFLTPLAVQTESHVENSEHFVKTMRDVWMMEDEVLVTFDVVSFFTNVPIGEAVKVIQEMLRDE